MNDVPEVTAATVTDIIDVTSQQDYDNNVKGKTCIVYFWESGKGQIEFPYDNLLIQVGQLMPLIKIDLDSIDGAFKDVIVESISEL